MRADTITDFSQFATQRADARQQSPEALRRTAQQFEALLTQQMLKSMRAASLGEDVMGGEQTAFYTEMFDQQLATHMASGKGLGLADLLVRQLRGQAPAAAPAVSETTKAFAIPTPPSTAAVGARTEDCALGADCTPEEFVRAIQPHAEAAAAELGVPSRVLIAQAALETGWGKHAMRSADGDSAYNLFGIKADRRWKGESVNHATTEFEDGAEQRTRADFRSYASIADSFDDYTRFLKSNPRYAQALRHGGSAQHFVHGLQQAGYATDPGYADKILKIANGRTLNGAMTPPRTYTV